MPRASKKRPLRNAEIAAAFQELADLYELDGAIVHRVLAYRNAARAVADASVSVAQLASEGRAQELPGIGNTLAEKIDMLLETGTIPSAERLKAKFPPGLVEITHVPGLGPKRARKLFDELGVCSFDDLRAAAEAGRLRDVPGFGPKAEQNVLAAVAAGREALAKPRLLLSRALELADTLAAALREQPEAQRVEIAGSARRRADTCKDIDLVASSTEPRALAEAFCALPLIAEASIAREAGARGVTHNGVSVELRIVPPESFGNLLQHFTGSKRHNEGLRAEAVRRGLHVSEYGVLDDEDGKTRVHATEEDLYAALGMAYVEPELREGRGELEAARAATLPALVELDHIRGELHCHTVASDGRNTIEQMAAAARERGYEYIAITDHSATHGFGNHVTPEALREQIERVRAIDAASDDIRVLAGSEVNVMPDGSLDYDDELLAELDWVVASLHSSFRMEERAMTDRMIAAMEHPLVDAIGHPTGRLIDRREPYALDLERVIEAAVRTGTFLEINGNPDRRDLSEVNARAAAEAGAKIVIDSDAHGTNTLGNVFYGVATARRAWMTKDDVANSRSWKQLEKLRKATARVAARR